MCTCIKSITMHAQRTPCTTSTHQLLGRLDFVSKFKLQAWNKLKTKKKKKQQPFDRTHTSYTHSQAAHRSDLDIAHIAHIARASDHTRSSIHEQATLAHSVNIISLRKLIYIYDCLRNTVNLNLVVEHKEDCRFETISSQHFLTHAEFHAQSSLQLLAATENVDAQITHPLY